MGIGSSGVRQIAEAAASKDNQRISLTILTVRKVTLLFGFLGMLVMFSLCRPLSLLSFGSFKYSWAIAILSITLFLGSISGGQIALIQGLRKITYLARLSVLGAFLGTITSIPIIFLWRENGIVPFLIAVSAMTVLTSWWYSRKIPILIMNVPWRKTFQEAKSLLSLGFVFMTTSLMGAMVIYLIRILVVRKFGVNGVGLYQAAITLSSIYIGVIISAMGMDFFPRLTAAAKDNGTCNRLVNEQTEVGILIAAPGVIATLIFTPMVLQVFYSESFLPAYDVLRWQVLGTFFRVLSWPIGYILLAKGKGRIFFFTELTANIFHVLFVWAGISYLGLEGTGIAFFAQYLFVTIMIFIVCRRITDFLWTNNVLHILIITLCCVIVAFLLPKFASESCSITLGIILTLLSIGYSLWKLSHLIGPECITNYSSWFKSLLKFRSTK